MSQNLLCDQNIEDHIKNGCELENATGSSNIQQYTAFDILGPNSISINEKFLKNFTKESSETLEREAKRNCKIIRFSSDWNFNEVEATISYLKPEEYPNLFIFVIEGRNFGFCEADQEENNLKINKIKEKLLKFSKARPYVMQLTSQDEGATKIFYKEDDSDDFTEVNQQENENCEQIENFSSFLCSFLSKKYDNFEDEMFYICSMTDVENLSIILRFLRTLKIEDDFYGSVVLKIAKNGTKIDLLAALDAPFVNEGRELSKIAQDYISRGFDYGEESSEFLNAINTAIENNNAEIIEYLISYWTHLIQQLPLKHRIKTSTTAFEKRQFDVLCDLLEIADFPFPQNFNTKMVRHKKLCKIVNERTAFKAAIEEENFEKINEYINRNLGFKNLYNPENNSALSQAVKVKKFGVFYYLKSLGFQGEDCSKILNDLTKEEIRQAMQQAYKQRKINVNKALPHIHNSIMLLFTRSLVHNKRISKEQETEYRTKIRKWLEDIYKIAPAMINVAASCENLKIIYDFESISVENVALKASTVQGTTYPSFKWIFIGAKLSDNEREQEIKGILAHELCHYVMRLVYNNNEHPYHKHEEELEGEFDRIVKAIDKWSSRESKPDDGCNKIISEVYLCYGPENFHPELIVRVVHILAEFDLDDNKLKCIQDKYKILFDYWENNVIPEMLKYLQKNQATIKLNGTFGLLSELQKEKIGFSSTKDIKALTESKLTIVTTNVRKLLLINIYKYVREEFGDLYDTKNLFIGAKLLSKPQIFQDFNQVCEQNDDLNIFFDCTKGMTGGISNIVVNNETRSTFIVSSESQRKKLIEVLNMKELNNITEKELNYKWFDLTVESQKLLLETKMEFQGNSEILLFDLLKKEVDPEEPTTVKFAEEQENEILVNFSEIIDCKILNSLMEKSPIVIKKDENLTDKNFVLLYQQRKIVKIKDQNIVDEDENSKENNFSNLFITPKITPTISQQKLLEEVKGKKYVLLSDMAGNGKSWAMKHFAIVLHKLNLTKWVVFVDLKQYIRIFRTQEVTLLTFIVQKVLKLGTNFEEKVFTKLYEKGKVLMFFDGFDEIAPDCAALVLKLTKSFEFNGGNQLWIATRDFFQIDLQEKLHLDIVYKLDEFTEKDGVSFIVKSWILNDLECSNRVMSKNDFEEYVKGSQNFKKYEEIAQEIVWKVRVEWNRFVGLPQIFKMVGDVSKDDIESGRNLKEFMLYKKFIQNLYNRWLREKGLLREEANTENLNEKPNYIQFHEIHAIKSMFPEYAERFFPGYDGNEWPEEEIIAFGLMSKSDEGYYFLHETYREYFVVDLLAKKMLEQKEPEMQTVELFVKILTNKKYAVIRRFLHNAIEDYSTLQKFEETAKVFYEKFYEMDSFSDIFAKKFENYMRFVITVLNTSLTDENCKNVDDLKKLIEKQKVFRYIIESSLEIEVFEELLEKVEAKTGREFITKMLLLKVPQKINLRKDNIFDNLSNCPNLSSHKIQKFLEIMKKYASIIDIFEKMKDCFCGTVLDACISSENSKNFEILWKGIKNFFEAENLPEKFKEFVKHKDLRNRTVLYSIGACCHHLEVHEIFWKLLLELFENREELKDYILEKDQYGNNFVHTLVEKNENPNTIVMAFDIFQKEFTYDQLEEIIKSKAEDGRNLLHNAAQSRFVEIIEFVWKFVRNYCHSDEEFLKILKEVDKAGENIFHRVLSISPKEIFEFIIVELKKIAPSEIKDMLSISNAEGVNLLQRVAWANHDIGLHEFLWDTFSEYFEPKEILEFIRHLNKKGFNLFYYAVNNQLKKETLELTWNKIKTFMTFDEQTDYLKATGSRDKIIIRKPLNGYSAVKKAKNDWIQKAIVKEYKLEFGA